MCNKLSLRPPSLLKTCGKTCRIITQSRIARFCLNYFSTLMQCGSPSVADSRNGQNPLSVKSKMAEGAEIDQWDIVGRFALDGNNVSDQ